MTAALHKFRIWVGRHGRIWMSIGFFPLLWGYAERDYYKSAVGAVIALVGIWGLMTRANRENVGPVYLRRTYLVTTFWLLLLGAAAGIWNMSFSGSP